MAQAAGLLQSSTTVFVLVGAAVAVAERKSPSRRLASDLLFLRWMLSLFRALRRGPSGFTQDGGVAGRAYWTFGQGPRGRRARRSLIGWGAPLLFIPP